MRQPGPVTLAIRGIRPNELPSWEMRQQQIEDEALRDLRRRVAKAVSVGIAFLDETGGDADLEEDAGDMPEVEDEHAAEDDHGEPSLCGTTVSSLFAYNNSLMGDLEEQDEDGGEHDGREPDEDEPSLGSIHDEDQSRWAHSDTRDREAGDDNGLADSAGWAEQRVRHLDMGGDMNRAGGRT